MKLYAVMASGDKGEHWVIVHSYEKGICVYEDKKTAKIYLEERYQYMKNLGYKVPRKYFKLVEFEEVKQ